MKSTLMLLPDLLHVLCFSCVSFDRYKLFNLQMFLRFTARKRNGVCPAHFCRSSGSVARKALQSLEALRLIEAHPEGGRKLTVQGQRDIDRIAAQIIYTQKERNLVLAASSQGIVAKPAPAPTQ